MKSVSLPCSMTSHPFSFRMSLLKMASGRVGSCSNAYGGSAKIKLYLVRHALRNLNTSPRMTLRLRMPNCLQQLIIQFCCTCAISTAVTSRAPRLTHSMPIPPVPAKRSSMSMPSKSRRLLSRLNKLSLAKSVVGLAVIFLGGDKRRPPYMPLIIRMAVWVSSHSTYSQLPALLFGA